MMDGWAFLVARGRHQGHRARLVPAVLAGHGLGGIVEEHGSGRPVDTPAGPVTLVSRTHRLQPAVLDEHGRPLEVRYGFACLGAPTEVHEADLAAALAQALETYDRFLADERGFQVELSHPFPLRSQASAPVPVSPRRVAVWLAAAGAPAALAAVLAWVALGGGPAPDDLTGTWRDGEVTVTITCAPGCPVPPGTPIGTVHAGDCVHTLVLDTAGDGGLRATAGGDCGRDGGPVTVRRTGGDRAELRWDGTGRDVTLRRT